MRFAMMLGRVLLMAVLALGSGACKNKPGSSKLEQYGVLTVPTGVTVKLVSAGKGPRQALRYRFTAGQKHTVELDMNLTVGVTTEVRSVPVQQLPLLRMHLTIEHRSVSPEGELQYAWRLDSATLVKEGARTELKSRYVSSLAPALQRIRGLSGTGLITARGVARKTEVKLPGSVPRAAQKVLQSLQQQLQQLATPFPEEPVGVGARWEVRRPMRMQTLRVGQVSQYEVVRWQGGKVVLKLAVRQFAPPQALGVGQLPAGASVQLNSYEATGEGQLELDLGRAVPVGSVETRSKLKQVVSAKGKTKPMELNLGVKATFREAGAGDGR